MYLSIFLVQHQYFIKVLFYHRNEFIEKLRIAIIKTKNLNFSQPNNIKIHKKSVYKPIINNIRVILVVNPSPYIVT